MLLLKQYHHQLDAATQSMTEHSSPSWVSSRKQAMLSWAVLNKTDCACA